MFTFILNIRNHEPKKLISEEKVIARIKKLPKKFSLDDLIDEVILLQKIETGLKQSDNNEVIPDEQLKNNLPKWLG